MTLPTPAGESRFTDLMVRVPSLAESVNFWKDVFGFLDADAGEGWSTLRDPNTGQRMTLVEGDIGAPWALAVAAEDMDAAVKGFEARGGELLQRTETAEGESHCRCRAPDGVIVLFYSG